MNRSHTAQLALTLQILCAPSGLFAEVPLVVRNGDRGLWEGTPGKSFQLIEDLVIGASDGHETQTFGRIYGIAVNSKGEIFVLDNGFVRVQKYDSTGAYLATIGNKGEGPGEFIHPMAITVDESGRLYVADRSRISVFDSAGQFATSLASTFGGRFVRSIKVTDSGEILVSCFDQRSRQILHRFHLQRGHVGSFCDSYALGGDVNPRVEGMLAGGSIDLDSNGNIYFTQLWPYEVRKFSQDGRLILTILRESTFQNKQPAVEIGPTGITLGPITGSYSIVLLRDGSFMNVVKRPPGEETPQTMLDLFDPDGRLLFSQRLDNDLNIRCRDSKDRLYAACMDEYPKVVRFRISYHGGMAK